MATTKWSDDQFLDSLRLLGDAQADACVEALICDSENEGKDFHLLFKGLNSNSAVVPEGIPDVLRRFFEDTAGHPVVDGQPADLERLERGGSVLLRNAFLSALALVAKSLNEGYAAPNLAVILSISKNLERNPYDRLLGVLQMVINVCNSTAFGGSGNALITAQKLRLLHAGVRLVVREPEGRLPGFPEDYPKDLGKYEELYQVPVNLEDMLGTIMGFSLLVVDGMQNLGARLSDSEAEDFYYVWRTFGQAMGIHPPGKAESSEFIPTSLAEAREFYTSYSRRHYRPVEENPEGVALAQSNLDLMNALLPQTPLRRMGLKLVPRVYMQYLMGKDLMRQVGIKPVRGFWITRGFLGVIPFMWRWFWKCADRLGGLGTRHERLSYQLFQRLITKGVGVEVNFRIPQDLSDLHELGERRTDC
ncbi:MAG: hypothetical protein ACI8UO_004228 [Verrucomicrobiales bacterium]|jgi:hypothetical protein